MVFRISLLALASLAVPGRSSAQPDASAATTQFSVSAIALTTRATPTAARQSLTETYLVQPMLNAGWRRPRMFAAATIDLEGLTVPKGELTTGMHGEGYVDRRHPHTYLHEVVVGANGSIGSAAFSLTAGKGFVPFGSDDPMMRPTVKYPINHHLAQILERATVIAGARYRVAVLEAAVFNGDEPERPASSPRLANFGDSWATRVIVGDEVQLSASYAFVRSPENRHRQALDQRKQHAAIRWTLANQRATGLVEWARSREGDPGGAGFTFTSLLAEGAWRSGGWTGSARLERTDRPEEVRTANPFRTPRPAIDQSLIGITRWSVATLTGARDVIVRRMRVSPFVELSLARAKARGPSPFQPASYYGSERLWMVSLGARVLAGPGHAGMGYYGVRRSDSTASQHHH